MSAIEFGAYLHRLRTQRNLTLEELSKMSGVSASQISRIETNNRNTPKPETIKMLAEAIKFPYVKLLEAAGYISPSKYMELEQGMATLIDWHNREIHRLEKEIQELKAKK